MGSNTIAGNNGDTLGRVRKGEDREEREPGGIIWNELGKASKREDRETDEQHTICTVGGIMGTSRVGQHFLGEYLGTSWVGIAKGRTGKRGETAKDGKDERRKDAEREQGMIVKG